MNDLTPAELAYERQQQLYALKGVAVDAFGEPLAEQTGSTGVVRQIPITEDLLREDAQRREAIEIRKEGITWRRPEPLPATTYRKPAKPARTPMRRTTAPTTQRTAVVPVQKEELPMETTQDTQPTCAVAACDKALTANNKTGRCSKHWYVKQGTAMKDGSIHGGGTPAKKSGKKPDAKKPLSQQLVSAAPPLTYAATSRLCRRWRRHRAVARTVRGARQATAAAHRRG